jgi:hypothetical protein
MAALLMLGGCVQVSTTLPPVDGTAGASPSPDGNGRASGRRGAAGETGARRQGYRFLHTRDDGEPVRWSTCEPIEYVVRPANEPDGARSLLEGAVARISEVTGLSFAFAGTTDEAPAKKRRPYHPKRYGDGWSPVLVTYSGPAEYPRLKGGAAGYAGPVYVRAGNRAARYVSGMVVLDADQLSAMGEDGARGVVLHELAHVVGLGHVKDRGQLMNPVQYGRGVTDLQPGDLAGLRALGNGRCFEPVEPRQIGR